MIANGDIASPEQARQVIERTGADAVMIGRAAQGDPSISGDVGAYLETGRLQPPPPLESVRDTLLEHLRGLYDLSMGRSRDCG